MIQVKHLSMLDLHQFNETVPEGDKLEFDEYINTEIDILHQDGKVTTDIRYISEIDLPRLYKLGNKCSVEFLKDVTNPFKPQEFEYLTLIGKPLVSIIYNHKL